MEKDKHVLPDTSDTFGAKVRRGTRHKERTGVIYGADNKAISKVDTPDSKLFDSLNRKDQ